MNLAEVVYDNTYNVDSSAIRLITHNQVTKELTVTFKTGSIYKYLDVGVEEVEDMLVSPSIGTYYNSYIRNRYDCVRVLATKKG